MSDISDSAILGIPNYDMYVSTAFHSMQFRGKTLSVWESELMFPDISDDIDFISLKQYNADFVNKTKVIMNNLSFAKVALKGCDMQYEMQIGAAKAVIMDKLREKNPSGRLPSMDSISSMAERRCVEARVAKEIAEMFLAFWQSQYDKAKIIDSRLAGIGYLYGLEVKNTHYG